MSMGGGGGGGQRETMMERAQADIGAEKWTRYTQKIRPLENQLIGKVLGYGSQAQHDRSIGDSVQAMRKAQGQSAINPNSPASAATGIANAVNLAGAANEGERFNRQRESAGLKGVVDLGAGLDSGATQMVSRLAALEGQEAKANAIQDATDNANKMNGIGTLAGLAIGKGMNNGWFKDKYGLNQLSEQGRMLREQDQGF
jgi:hypothetical protein